jgi:Glycine/D-amino acid oxidases (deaminating)
MTVSIWQQAHRTQETAYDVIVVGGGIVGCSTAYWLGRRAPSLNVGLLEARTLGAGASGRNAGFVLQGTHADYRTDMERYGAQTARRLWQFTRENRDLLSAELRGTAFSWRADGGLVAAGTEKETSGFGPASRASARRGRRPSTSTRRRPTIGSEPRDSTAVFS